MSYGVQNAAAVIGRSELVAGIIGTVDVGSIIGNALTLQQDINRANTYLTAVESGLQTYFKQVADESLRMAQGDGLPILVKANIELWQHTKALFDLTRDQAVQGAAGFKISAITQAIEAKFYATINHVDLLTKALIDLPERYALDKVVKYYNKNLAPNRPSDTDIMIQIKNGTLQFLDLIRYYQENLGVSEIDAFHMMQKVEQLVGKPDLYSYWIMARKGLISNADWFFKAQLGHGYSIRDATALYEQFYYTFSPMELFRISDLMPTSPTWIDKKLKALGLSDEDRPLIATLINARTTKDEVNQAWGILLDNFSWGLQTEDDLTSFLTQNNVPDVQVKAKLTVAKLLKEKVILKLMRDAEIYLYRKSVLNENQLLTALQDLEIGLDVANAITRNEACKKGIDWEIPE